MIVSPDFLAHSPIFSSTLPLTPFIIRRKRGKEEKEEIKEETENRQQVTIKLVIVTN